MRKDYRWLLACLIAGTALTPFMASAEKVASLRIGGSNDATKDVRAWHDDSHRSCPFVRVLEKADLPAEADQDTAQKWVIEACRGAKYEYRVVHYTNGAIQVSDLHETSAADVPGTAGEDQVADNAPADRLTSAKDNDALARLEAATAPYIAQGRATWPATKAAYSAKGMPPGHILFVTVRLYEGARYEQVFVRVDRIDDDSAIHGRIASEITSVSGYRNNDPIVVADADVLDWTISRPDGSEEGNFVGKFLDTYDGQ